MKLVDEDGNKVKNQYAHLNLLEALESQIKVKVRLDVRFTEILENTFNNNHTQMLMTDGDAMKFITLMHDAMMSNPAATAMAKCTHCHTMETSSRVYLMAAVTN